MNGRVDESLRALLEIPVAARRDGQIEPLDVWIDTAFNGGLVLPRQHIERLGLQQASTTQAILADGQLVELETFTCYLEWFGHMFKTQVVANEGGYPHLGTVLLANRKLLIDYAAKIILVE